jgi:hypothetical protein
MMPFVNSLLDSPGILRDSLGNLPFDIGPGGAPRGFEPVKRPADAPKFRIARRCRERR